MSRKPVPLTVVPLALARARNGFGKPLSPDAVARVLAFVNDPCETTWNAACSVIIAPNRGVTTVWQAVVAVDPTFPRSGPVLHTRKGWARIPTAGLVIAAIEFATSKRNDNSELAR